MVPRISWLSLFLIILSFFDMLKLYWVSSSCLARFDQRFSWSSISITCAVLSERAKNMWRWDNSAGSLTIAIGKFSNAYISEYLAFLVLVLAIVFVWKISLASHIFFKFYFWTNRLTLNIHVMNVFNLKLWLVVIYQNLLI